MADAHKNFAYSTVTGTVTNNGLNPGTAGTSITVADASLFPTPPFNATIWPTGSQPTYSSNTTLSAEIIRVNSVATNTFSVTRQTETPGSRNCLSGDQIAASITAKTLTDIEENYVGSWSPFIPSSGGTGIQTLQSANAQFTTNSLFVFPITVQFPVRFNQIILPVQLSVVSSSTSAASHSHSSFFGLYSMQTNNTFLSLISSNSFSIGETMSAASLTWNFPTSTATSGYGYGSFPAGNLTDTNQIGSFVNGSRAIGLQFGGEMSISGGQYWLGLLYKRNTAGVTRGLSVVGVVGQIINPINMAGAVSGVRPIGDAPSEWAISNTHISGWFGRQLIGFISATTVPGFLGTGIPSGFALHRLGATAAASMGTILPMVTFCST
jgi:hypothetical protein